jgi:hypothetical protein
MNLTTMITLVRQDLHDEIEETYRWTDDELTRHIAHAVKDFSLQIPLESIADLVTDAGSRSIDISSLTDGVRIETVEYPVGQFPPFLQRFSLWGDTLTLLGADVPDGSNCKITYGTLHTLDADSSSIPVQHEDLVAAGACGYAASALAGYSINQVNTGGAGAPKDWAQWSREKLAFFQGEIKRLGYRNKVRITQLYVPYYPIVSKSTDPGP